MGTTTIKYPKPKVILLDVDKSSRTSLANEGFNISAGTLGTPYRVSPTSGYEPIICKASFPNYTEQDIIVVDLQTTSVDGGPQGEKHRPDGETDLWAKCDKGIIDPRVRSAISLAESFERIFEHEGVFVVFAAMKSHMQVISARISQRYGLQDEKAIHEDEWSFLNALKSVDVTNDHGTEMEPCDSKTPLGRLLASHLSRGQFSCTLRAYEFRKTDWSVLATNKFGDPVGVVLQVPDKGTVIIVPQIADKPGFLTKLFKEVLPDLAPHLFPQANSRLWLARFEYELSSITALREEQRVIEENAASKLKALSRCIDEERATNGWIHDLLVGSDTELVSSVKRALGDMGFQQIVDVDEEQDRDGKPRREDLQILDARPTIVIDVKGINFLPSDEDALQADKHTAMRMREWKRTDVIGLSLINHQRHMPPLERDNAMPFRAALIDAALERSLGLMTTWDLFRLLRNLQKLGWPAEAARAVFYRSGRIEPIPAHYVFLGTIAKAWTEKFGVDLDCDLSLGDTIAVEFPVEFEEVKVTSIQVNGRDTPRAAKAEPAGLLWPNTELKLREGMRVFKIIPFTQHQPKTS